jgi:MoaA/NifB/PqqE/SkfB family radical SAM enzyme
MADEGKKRDYFCEEPWVGVFSVLVDGTVRCCPCYAQVVIGNIHSSTSTEIWNSPVLVEMRRAFEKGNLPEPCKGQLCPVVSGAQ